MAEDREPKQWRVGNPITEGLTDPAKKLECSKGSRCPITNISFLFEGVLRNQGATGTLRERSNRAISAPSSQRPGISSLAILYYLSFIKFKSRFSELLLMRGMDG